MSMRIAAGAAFGALLLVATPPVEAGGRVEGFAGYYFAEELEEDLAYGVRAGWDSGNGWGLMWSFEMFETAGEGYGVRDGVDGDITHLELSYVAYPGDSGFELFSGLGATDLDIDIPVPGHIADLEGTELSIHAGIGWRWEAGDTLYLRPELRARVYEAEDETIDITASLALGFDWGN
jgi:hypothetical protein